jgi:type I restriction enzyme R subunit
MGPRPLRGEPVEAANREAVKPLADPALRNLLLKLRQQADQIIDIVTQDTLIEAGFSAAATERAKSLVQTFEAFIAEHRDEITALQILYNRPVKAPLTFEDIKALADTLHAPPHLLTESALWQAYAALDKSKGRRVAHGAYPHRPRQPGALRHAPGKRTRALPRARRRQLQGLAGAAPFALRRRAVSIPFTPEQQHWLEMIRDHIAANLGIDRRLRIRPLQHRRRPRPRASAFRRAIAEGD